MSERIVCDAPGCEQEIDLRSADVAFGGVRSVTLRGAPDWNYQQEGRTVALVDNLFLDEYAGLLGGYRVWEQGGTPTFHACSDEHLLAILKAAPTGSHVVEFNRVVVKAAALAAVLHVMAEDERANA